MPTRIGALWLSFRSKSSLLDIRIWSEATNCVTFRARFHQDDCKLFLFETGATNRSAKKRLTVRVKWIASGGTGLSRLSTMSDASPWTNDQAVKTARSTSFGGKRPRMIAVNMPKAVSGRSANPSPSGFCQPGGPPNMTLNRLRCARANKTYFTPHSVRVLDGGPTDLP